MKWQKSLIELFLGKILDAWGMQLSEAYRTYIEGKTEALTQN